MRLHLNDPGGAALRKASRVALVMTAMTAFGAGVVQDAAFTTFTSFGCIALLSFANFGGPLAVRFRLGLGFTVLGAALIVVGSYASVHLVTAVVFMAAVGFVLTFSGVFGGYPAAGGTGLILAAVLSVMVPGGTSDLAARLSGWAAAGVVGSVAMVALWPERPRPRVRLELAAIARRVAAELRDLDGLTPDTLLETRQQVLALRQQVDSSLSRPGGPRAKDQALLYLLDELGRTTVFVDRLVRQRPADGTTLLAADRDTLASSADVLEASAEVLTGSNVDPPTGRLVQLRADEISAVRRRLAPGGPEDGTAAPPTSGDGPLVERFDLLFPVRMLSYLAMSVASNALVAMGRPPGDTSFEIQSSAPALRQGRSDVVHRTVATLRTHLRPQSRWFRNAVRAAVALGASAAVADLVHLEHSFWVVLGTLSVLRSSVMDTGASAVQSISGTVLGFAVATGVIVSLGDRDPALWVLLPITIFAAAYLSTVVSYLVGQAAFTVLVVVLFNLLEPTGWSLGLVRVERVALGVAVSVIASIIIWPRGVNHDLAKAVAAEYHAAIEYVRATLRAVLGAQPAAPETDPTEGTATASASVPDEPALATAHYLALSTRALTESEFGDLMNSRGSKEVGVDTWARLVAQPHALILGGDWMRTVVDHQGMPATSSSADPLVRDAVAALHATSERVLDPLEHAADRLAEATRSHPAAAPDPHLTSTAGPPGAGVTARGAVRALLADDRARGSVSDHQVIGLLWSVEWLSFVHDLADDVAAPLADATTAVQRSWWR